MTLNITYKKWLLLHWNWVNMAILCKSAAVKAEMYSDCLGEVSRVNGSIYDITTDERLCLPGYFAISNAVHRYLGLVQAYEVGT